MSFRLFRLPYLAIVQVFKTMAHETLFLLPYSTRKGKDYIRMYLPKEFIIADFDFGQLIKVIPGNSPCHFRIYGFITDWPTKAIRCQIGNDLAAIDRGMGQMDFYWSRPDLNFALSSFISQINVCWNCPKISVTLDGRYDVERISIFMEEVKRNNLKISSMYLLKKHYIYGDEFVNYLIQCLDVNSKLVIDSRIDGFLENGYSRNSIRVKELEITNCDSVILERFMNSKSIKVECVSIQNHFGVYINTFIKQWMKDYECNLEIVTITNCPFSFEQITKGLERLSSCSVEGVSLQLQREDRKHILITLNEGVLKIELIGCY